MEPIQIILALIVLFALSRVVLRYKDKRLSSAEFAFWAVIFGAALIVILAPGTAGALAALVGIGRPVDLVIYVSIVVIFYLMFKLYVHVDGIKEQITTIVREVAIKKAKKKK